MNKFAIAASTLTTALAAVLASQSAHALYKVVNPDGSVSFTDRPPAEGATKSKISTLSVNPNGGASMDPNLPYETRQAAQKFPVVLYTIDNCEACQQGRELLTRRGVPFRERLANTSESKAAWIKTTGTTDVPVLMVGKERLSGYNSGEWTSTLSAAGYPASAKVPSGYKPAVATELAERKAPTEVKKDTPVAAPAEAAPSGAGGIRF